MLQFFAKRTWFDLHCNCYIDTILCNKRKTTRETERAERIKVQLEFGFVHVVVGILFEKSFRHQNVRRRVESAMVLVARSIF